MFVPFSTVSIATSVPCFTAIFLTADALSVTALTLTVTLPLVFAATSGVSVI